MRWPLLGSLLGPLALAGCASSPGSSAPDSASPTAAQRSWEAPHLAHMGEEPEPAYFVQQIGSTTSPLPRRQRTEGGRCPLTAGQHLGRSFRVAGDAFDDERRFVLHLTHPATGWTQAVPMDGTDPIFIEPCGAVDPAETSRVMQAGQAERGYQPLGFWIHLPPDVDPRALDLSWSWSW